MTNKVRGMATYPIEIYTSEQLGEEKPDGIISNFTLEKKYQDVPFFSTSLFYSDWTLNGLGIFLNRLADNQTKLF